MLPHVRTIGALNVNRGTRYGLRHYDSDAVTPVPQCIIHLWAPIMRHDGSSSFNVSNRTLVVQSPGQFSDSQKFSYSLIAQGVCSLQKVKVGQTGTYVPAGSNSALKV
jgi:hypothetical protein